jgi:hypothetical protein
MKLREYIEAYEPPDSFLEVGCVYEDRVEVGRGAKVLVQAIDVWAK